MRSALGIRRIKDVDVSQVLHATDADIRALQNRLRSWGISSFRNYPVLLRALTHPSISNWAERILRLPKRSLSPNTLELLGDRVVGAATAYRALQWRKAASLNVSLHRNKPNSLLKSLVGNRGMALVAADVGIDDLIRWEKSTPPESHRDRLTAAGVDEVTGILSNTHINALASAYEAVSAAIYLDGGFVQAERFVHNTLLRDPRSVQEANVDVTEHEEALARELESMTGIPVSFIPSRYRPGRSGDQPIKSFERVQCEMLDLESTTPQNEAHRLYFSGISLRPMQEVGKPIGEEDLLFVASHFSVENARIAALTGCLDMLRGQTPARISGRGTRRREKLQMRKIVYGSGSPEIEVGIRDDGGWWLDGDYSQHGMLLARAGVAGMDEVVGFNGADVREALQGMHATRCGNVDDADDGRRRGEDVRNGAAGDEALQRTRDSGKQEVCTDLIRKCLDIGVETESSGVLLRTYDGIREDFGTAEEVSQGLREVLDEVSEKDMAERSELVRSYHSLGHSIVKMWGVQRSMSDISQDRVEVIKDSLQRARLPHGMQSVMIGDGLDEIGDVRARKVFVGLGMCGDRIGLQTALAWLSGGEEMARGVRG